MARRARRPRGAARRVGGAEPADVPRQARARDARRSRGWAATARSSPPSARTRRRSRPPTSSGFVHHEALACELASRFYRGRGLARVAELYLREAHACYRRWGAHAKAGQLEQLHPQLVAGPQSEPAAVALRAEQLDLVAAIKASQTISGVMDARELWHTLLRLVLEDSGARRAVLVVPRAGELEIAAETAADDRAALQSSVGRAALDPALRAADAAAGGARRGRRSGPVRARRVVRPRAAALDPVRADPAAGRGGGAALPRERSGVGGVSARAAAGARAPGRAGGDLARERAAPGGRARGAAFGRGRGAARAAARRGDGADVALAGSTGRGRRAGPPVRARGRGLERARPRRRAARSSGSRARTASPRSSRSSARRWSGIRRASIRRRRAGTCCRPASGSSCRRSRRSSSAPAAPTTTTASSCSGWGRAARWRCRSA